MRIHRLAMLAILTTVVGVGCDAAQEYQDDGRSNAYRCDSCHGYPPTESKFFPSPEAKPHPQGVTAPMCAVCHPGTVQADGHSMVADGEHRNGHIEFRPFAELECNVCHAALPRTGAHVFHVEEHGVACAACHRGFDPVAKTVDTEADVHMNGRADAILPDGTVIPTVNEPDHTWTAAECRACHPGF